jgi:hypothetical protein
MPTDTTTSMDLGPIEADFAVLRDDLERIASANVSIATVEMDALTQILGDIAKVPEGAPPPDPDDVGSKFQKALLGVLKESAAADMHGNMAFDIDQKSLLTHGAPVLQEAISVVQQTVQNLLGDLTKSVVADLPKATVAVPTPPAPAPAKAEAPAPEPAPAKPPEKQAVKVKFDLTSMFAGLLQSAIQQAKEPPKKG